MSSPSKLPSQQDEDIEINEKRREIETDEDIQSDYFSNIGDAVEDSDDEGEDLYGDNMMRDYQYDPTQDTYDPTLLDENEVEPLTYHQRFAAEEAMNQRDAKDRGEYVEEETIGANDDVGEDDDIEDYYQDLVPMNGGNIDDEEDDELDQHDEEVKGDLISFLSKDVKTALAENNFRKLYGFTFKKFIEEFEAGTDQSTQHHFYQQHQQQHKFYIQRIEEAARQNHHSILVNFMHMSAYNPILNLYLTDAPAETLTIMNEVLEKKVKELYPNFHHIHQQWYVRFYNVNSNDSIRDLRHTHLNVLISIKGVVTRRTGVFPQLKVIKYDCGKCGHMAGPFVVSTVGKIPKPTTCASCQSKGPFTVNQTQTLYQNYQKITLQESPGSIPAGRIPRSKEVVLLDDLIDAARPGDEVEVTGIYKHSYNAMLNVRQGFPVFGTVIEANSVRRMHDRLELDHLTDMDKKCMDRLKRCKNLQNKVMHSIAPSIFGHEDLKLAIALAMIGAARREYEGKHSVRGDINILMVGDPGTAKSQFLKYIEKTARRAVYTTGKGSTAVGLTASVRKDAITGEWVLEGGALVLADRGTCLIDEFDKMNDQDRTSIHEAMEQQTISISKAGIVTTLQARCSVVAAANPVRGKYDTTRTFRENVDLTDPILSRFDVLSVVRDTVDASIDERLARFVVDSHANSHPSAKFKKSIAPREVQQDSQQSSSSSQRQKQPHWSEDNDLPIPQDFLKKYIAKAKEISMNSATLDSTRLRNFWADLRGESKFGGGIPITMRHLESMIRLSEANARLHLRDSMIDDDVTTAIRLMLESFISTQKYAVSKTLRQKYQAYLKSPKDNNRIILHILNQIVTELTGDEDDEATTLTIDVQMLKDKVRTLDIHSIDAFLKDEKLLTSQCITYDEDDNVLIKTFI
jgi:DNA replication licensing factor MCM2